MHAQRGWSGSSRAKPADAIEIRSGHDLLRRESAGWPRYLAVTSPTAYRVAQPYLAAAPAGVALIRSLDFAYLRQTSQGLPDDAGLVVGLGGGQALDAAKHVAVAKDLPLIQVPTILSTGAIIHGHCGRFSGRTLTGDRENWVWADCEYVLVDYDLALEAPMHLHTAGLGDVLCEHSGIAEWRHGRRRSPAADPEPPELAALAEFHRLIVESFPATLDARGALTAESIAFIMRTLQQRDAYRVRLASAPNVDHAFLFALEEVNDRSWIHGEVVAMGALIVAWSCAEAPDAFAADLDRCRVRRRPSQLGIRREELRRGLTALSQRLADRPGSPEYNSILRTTPVAGKRFDALWAFLEAA